MEGLFKATILDASSLTPAERDEAVKYGLWDELLDLLPTKTVFSGKNMVFDNFAAWAFYAIMSGGGVTDPYDFGGASNSPLAHIGLLYHERAPYYQESTHQNLAPGSLSYMVTSDAWKRFIVDEAQPYLIQVAPDGREEVQFRSRFMFAAGEANADNIRCFAVYFCESANSTGTNDRGIIAKIRLQDAGGTLLTLEKTVDEVLLLEYWFKLVSL